MDGALASPAIRLGRWASWLALPLAAVLLLAGSSPWIGQRLPRFLLPALAFAGAVSAAVAFFRAVRRLVHGRPAERGPNLRRLFARSSPSSSLPCCRSHASWVS